MALENLMVFTGNANPELARGVAEKLGIPLGKANVSKFSDGEVMVEIKKTFAARTSSCCSPPARRPTTT
jgi:ribose-phosphate pyrophosphokinase